MEMGLLPDSTAVIASLTDAPEPGRLEELASQADILEVRADLFEPLDLATWRRAFPGRWLYTLRSREEGGKDSRSPAERRELLHRAALEYDLVDLEQADLEPETLEVVPVEKRLLSWHGSPSGFDELQRSAHRLLETPAHWYKVVIWADSSGPSRWPLVLLGGLGRDDVIAFAAGEPGRWSRLVAPMLGSPAVFTAAGPVAAASGQPPVEQLHRDFCWPLPEEISWLFGVVGNPVAHSLSPYLFNRALRELEIPALYVPFHVENFGEFWLDLVEEEVGAESGYSLRGLSVTAPDKRIAMAVAGATSPLTERIGSANTLVNREGVWEADSTDAEGVLGPLRRRQVVVRGLRAAVLGAGGAGRAAAFALASAGAEVEMFNRGAERGARAAAELKLPCLPWGDFDPSAFDIVAQATPLGRSADDPLPCEPTEMKPDAIGLDLVYLREGPTPWVAALRAADRTGIDGREVLLHQAIPQFAAMTGQEIPSALVGEFLVEMEAT